MGAGSPLALGAGAGAGLGQSLCARLDAAGHAVVGFGSSRPETVTGAFHALDLSDPEQTCPCIADLIQAHGPPRIVIHNPAELVIAPFSEATLGDYQRCWASMVQTLVLVAQATLQPMVRGGGGTLFVSGATASLRGGARFSSLASAKFALRGLTQSLAREYQPAGIHIVHTTLDAIIDTPRLHALHDLDPRE